MKGTLNAPSLPSFAKSRTKGTLNAPSLPSFAKSRTKGALNAPSLPLNEKLQTKGTNPAFLQSINQFKTTYPIYSFVLWIRINNFNDHIFCMNIIFIVYFRVSLVIAV